MSYEYTNLGNYGGLGDYYGFGDNKKKGKKYKSKNRSSGRGSGNPPWSGNSPWPQRTGGFLSRISQGFSKDPKKPKPSIPGFQYKAPPSGAKLQAALAKLRAQDSEVGPSAKLSPAVAMDTSKMSPKQLPDMGPKGVPDFNQGISPPPLPPPPSSEEAKEMTSEKAIPIPPGVPLPQGMVIAAPGMMRPAYGRGAPSRLPTPPPKPIITPQQARLGTMAAALGAGLLFF